MYQNFKLKLIFIYDLYGKLHWAFLTRILWFSCLVILNIYIQSAAEFDQKIQSGDRKRIFIKRMKYCHQTMSRETLIKSQTQGVNS